MSSQAITLRAIPVSPVSWRLMVEERRVLLCMEPAPAPSAILAACGPVGAPWPKYSVMSGRGAVEDLVECTQGSASLLFCGLPMVIGAIMKGLAVCRQARLGASERHVCSRSNPSHAPIGHF